MVMTAAERVFRIRIHVFVSALGCYNGMAGIVGSVDFPGVHDGIR
jgi:hypothetical protein